MGFIGGRRAAARLGNICARLGRHVVAGCIVLLASTLFGTSWAGCFQNRCKSPGVTIAIPVANATYGTNQSITISGRATGNIIYDAVGEPHEFGITRVEISKGGTFVSNATLGASGYDAADNPWRDYSYTFAPMVAGTYTFQVKSVDSDGEFSNVREVTVTVASSNASPTVSITSPSSGDVVTRDTPVTLTASASDSDGSVVSVQYYDLGNPVSGLLTTPPYTFSWTPTTNSSHILQAVAIDNAGASTTSAYVSITANDKPVVQLSVSGVNTQNPGSITLQGSATDSIGGVTSIGFYVNNSLLATGSSYTWTGVTPGTYTIVARAYDPYTHGDSAPYVFVVNAPPSVSIASPASGAVSSAPGSFTFTANASDGDGSISNVQYFAGTTAISGAVTGAPYAFTWSSVATGTYAITARATDNSGAVTTSAPITVISNDAPTVSLSTSGAAAQAPGAITLQASASDSLGGVSSVQYFANSNAISSALTSAPYAFNWGNVSAGTYSIVARATDGYGRTADSNAYSFSVNAAPSVTLTAPANGSVINTGVPASIVMAANASDGDGSISKVEFLVNGNIVATSTAAPFTASWSASTAGGYSVQARATDNAGGVSNSAIAIVSVDAVPTTAITSPANGATFSPGLDIPITMSAGDSDGSIAKVEVYDGASLIATLTSAPYATTLADAPAGTHVLSAKAYDNQGAITTSASVTINVAFNAPPVSSGSGTPGKLAGSMSVSGNGAAQYVIPIAIPPGTAGMVPSIALKYDSSGGNGVAGVGWSITGLSQISRCGRDFAHEGLKAGIQLTSTDPFCLDGQRLILKSGTYGAANSEYRTEIDRFSKIIALGTKGTGPNSFLVTLKDGTKFEYGSTTDSQMVLPYATPAPVPAPETPIAWSVNKVSDPRGNYYTVTYATTTGQQVPTRIDYTGNITAPILNPYNSIQFSYETRADTEMRYVVGAKVVNSQRLASIKTYAGPTFVKQYRLAYDTSASTARSRIQRVTECGDAAGTTCLPSTNFNWEDTQAGTVAAAVSFVGGPTEFNASVPWAESHGGDHYWVDINGDGRPEHCYSNGALGGVDLEMPVRDDFYCMLTQPGSAAPVASYIVNAKPNSGFTFVDVNGDGITDVCGSYCMVMGPSGAAQIYHAVDSIEGNLETLKVHARVYLDYDGSGKAGVCAITNGGVGTDYHMECAHLTPTTEPAPTPINYGAVAIPSCTGSNCQTLQFAWPDISGDGIPSFCRIDGNVVRCNKIFATGLGLEVNTGPIDLGEKAGRAWADVNGDGKADFCRVISSAPGQVNVPGTLQCTLSTGLGFGDTVVSPSLDIGFAFQRYLTVPDYKGRNWLDVNGDGKADYCRAIGLNSSGNGDANSSILCQLSTGSGFAGSVSVNTGVYSRYAVIGDMSADGKPDFCAPGPTGMIGAQCKVVAGTGPDVLLSLTDGLGASSSLQYRPISDSTVYTKGTGAAFPTADLQDTTRVVQQLSTSNGVGGTLATTYKYEGAKVHRQGRGFLGFAVASNTSPTGVVSRVERNTDFPLTGTPAKTLVSSGGVTLSDATNSYVTAVSNGSAPLASYVVYPNLSVAKTYDLSGAFVNWVEKSACGAVYSGSTFSNWADTSACAGTKYDGYGNSLSSDTIYKTATGTPDGYSQASVTAYAYDTTNWILGRPTSLVTTSRIPGKPDSVRMLNSSYLTTNPGLGLLQQHIVEPTNGGTGATNLRLATDYTYDKFGNVLTKVVGNGGANITTRTEATYTYDTEGRFALTAANAKGHTETRTWDPKFGGMLTLQDANLLTSSWTYDLFGRKLTEDRPDGTRTTLAYNPCAACVPGSVYGISRTETVIASGTTAQPPSREYFDTLGRSFLSARMGFNGQDVYRETVYDSLGRAGYNSSNYFASDPTIRWTQFDYDVLGRAVKTTAPDNTFSTATYDGRKTTSTNHNGVQSSRTVNSQGKIIGIIDAEGSVDQSSIAYEYEHWGNLAKTTDAFGNVTTIEYDLLGRKTKLIDPDLGTWLYTVDNLGLVKTQTDAKNQLTSYTYDTLDRLTARSEPGLNSNWYYEKNAANVDCSKGIGKLCEATSDNPGYYLRNAYDSVGRLSNVTTHIDIDYLAQWSYDAAGRLSTQTFPASTGAAPLVTKYNYNANGILESVTDTASVAYWTRNTENADGNILSETYGNGLIGTRGYDPVMRRLTSLQAGPSGSPNSVQNQGYHYDSLGRLDQRQDNTADVGTSETFGYDNLSRLTTSILTGPTGTQTSTVAFNAIGNITSKSGVGTYAYNPSGAASVRPHAVAGLTGTVNGVANPSYAYDNNGNMLTDGARSFSWTSFNMPATLTKTAQAGSPGEGTSTFLYGPEHQRLKQTWVDSAKTLTTFYLADPAFEKEVNTQTGITEYKHYIKVGERIVAVQTRRNSGGGTWTKIANEDESFTVIGTQTVRYGAGSSWLTMTVTGSGECSNTFFGGDPIYGTTKTCEVSSGGASEDIKYLIADHLGSTSVVTDGSGAVVDRQAYDIWGDRRVASGASAGAADPTNLIQPTSTDRGYTGHEHLDQGNMGLVHMNGRVYDPTLGRFISADPNVPRPMNTQSFSRYSYVLNSPLNATDPTGYMEATVNGEPVKPSLIGFTVVYIDPGTNDSTTGSSDTASQEMSIAGPLKESAPAGNGSGFQTSAAAADGGGGDQPTAKAAGVSPEVAKASEIQRIDRAFEKAQADGNVGEMQRLAARYQEITSGNGEASSSMINASMASAIGRAITDAGGTPDAKVAAPAIPAVIAAGMGGAGPGGAAGAEKISTLKPGPFAKESIPGHMGKPTAAEQRLVNGLMDRNGCHTCGTKDPGTKTLNAVADHQPPKRLEQSTRFYPHCIDCARRQGGEVLQELIKRGQQ